MFNSGSHSVCVHVLLHILLKTMKNKFTKNIKTFSWRAKLSTKGLILVLFWSCFLKNMAN